MSHYSVARVVANGNFDAERFELQLGIEPDQAIDAG
jgi:hypothetical protein